MHRLLSTACLLLLSAASTLHAADHSKAKSASITTMSSNLAKQTLYCDRDSLKIVKRFLPVVDSHADYLAKHPEQGIRLEGHVDGTGIGPEYAVMLAEALAIEVERRLRTRGVKSQQIQIVSHGLENPQCKEDSDECRAMNSFVRIVYE